ncbi:MAG: hypothetical protein M9894_04190 [Planctomycetes bacterium]|nr:hypothetical protein [Planctomycetota bacterium]
MEALLPVLMVLGVVAFFALVLAIDQADKGEKARALSAFLRRLEGGHGRTELGFFEGLEGAWVEGRLGGLPVSLTFERRSAGKSHYHLAFHAVEVDNPAADFTLSRAGVLDRLGQWLGVTRRTDLHPDLDDDLVLRTGRSGAVKALLQQGELGRALRELLDGFELDEVRLEGGRLQVEERVGRSTLGAARLHELYTRLVRVARLCSRRPVPVKVKGLSVKPRFAWTGEGQAALCPYCRDEVPLEGGDVEACDRCGTLHHRACLDEAGGCTIFGCGAARTPRRERA